MVSVLKYIHKKQKALENPLGLKADRQSAIHYKYYRIFSIKFILNNKVEDFKMNKNMNILNKVSVLAVTYRMNLIIYKYKL